jgi:tetratricopeptide (TPR) repeat protein
LLDQAYGANAQTAPNYDKVLNDLGNLYNDAGRFTDAEKAFGRALAVGRATRGEDHPNVAATRGNLATVFESESRFTEAEELYKQTLAAYEKQFGSNHPLAAIALNNLAKPHR